MEKICKYSHLYIDADKSFVVNLGSKGLTPIRISLPKPPPLHLINGWGLHPDYQIFKRLGNPIKLKELERQIISDFSEQKRGINGNAVLKEFWKKIEQNRENYKNEIDFIRRFIYFMHNGYWCYIDGKPTFFPPYYFTYLEWHRMSTKKGYIYPEYRDKGRERFLFRHSIKHTRETFVDFDDKTNKAIKVDGKYRMVETERELFFGTVEPKGRREGLTNEGIHSMLRTGMSERGGDKLCTIVSMGGENAETHFKGKLMPAWKAIPLWGRPVWKGGMTDLKQLEFKANNICDVDTLDVTIKFTESAEDFANDGKMIIYAIFDEQGKGKKTGNVGNRWNVNKEAMSLGARTTILGNCMHPSTVEQMEEGGQEYKVMCNMSDFYKRQKNGQTISGVALCYFKSEYCLEGYVDVFGKAILEKPTERQKMLAKKYKKPIKRIGSRTFLENTRKDLYDESDPDAMENYRSFVRKFPQDYEDCWTGIAGQLGLDNEKIRKRLVELENTNLTKRGNFIWLNKARHVVGFVDTSNGKWIISKELPSSEANRVSSMEDYSSFADDTILVNRPANPLRFVMGIDPQGFSNKSESVHLESRYKLSDTSISILQKCDKGIGKDNEQEKCKTKIIIAHLRHRFSNSLEATEEALKAAIYYGALIHIESNKTEIWERLIEQGFGGYLSYEVTMSADMVLKRAPKPGTSMQTASKKRGFALLADHLNLHCKNEPIKEWLKEADKISSLEELTKFDGLASVIQSLFGDNSMYPELLEDYTTENKDHICLGAEPYYY